MTDTPQPFDAELRVAQYVRLRDHLRQMDDDHKAKRAQFVDLLAELEGKIQDFLDKSNAVNIKTKAGTAYVSTKYTASLADAEAFMRFVIDNKQFDLLDRRANSTAVQAFVKEHTTLPPGCNLNPHRTLGVRRSGDKSET